ATCVLLCLAGLLVPAGSAAARPARAPRLVAAFAGSTPSSAARHAVAKLHLRIGAPVFRGHRDWNIWELRSRRAGAQHDATATAPLAASLCTTPGSSCAAPPTSCAPGSAAGLDAGQANDPLFCNEPNGPYYSEEWNNFCFLPQTQSASVMAGAPRASRSSGTCNT